MFTFIAVRLLDAVSPVSSDSLNAPKTQHVWKSPCPTAPVDRSATTEPSEARQADISGAMGRLEQVRQNKGSQGRTHFGIFGAFHKCCEAPDQNKGAVRGSCYKKTGHFLQIR